MLLIALVACKKEEADKNEYAFLFNKKWYFDYAYNSKENPLNCKEAGYFFRTKNLCELDYIEFGKNDTINIVHNGLNFYTSFKILNHNLLIRENGHFYGTFNYVELKETHTPIQKKETKLLLHIYTELDEKHIIVFSEKN